MTKKINLFSQCAGLTIQKHQITDKNIGFEPQQKEKPPYTEGFSEQYYPQLSFKDKIL